MSTPEPGQPIEVTIRGTVRRVAPGNAVLVDRDDGIEQWFHLPDDLNLAVSWRPA